ncbi:hypothetical protein BV22DRAFT_1126168 [Leucogyrophana mollusca]|uniref:Uncharacterized protein n=1 Tax=Leucogyrophana mollusca TaxID=85980 RepID=A0ACB8BSM7_9AGAM|nr:hypothetical protein BV22DRAFT_1126168 [Leucogyrophana mollusca]
MADGGGQAAESTPALTVKVTDLKATRLPKIGLVKRTGKFYVRVSVDDESKETTAHKGPSWDEVFFFDVNPSSVLELQLYARRRLGADDYIGGTKGRIGSLLLDSEEPTSLSRKLSVYDAQGILNELDVSLDFTISHVLAAKAETDRVTEAVERSTKAVTHMNKLFATPEMPADLSTFAGAVTAGAVWDLLISRLKLLIVIADGIAEVHPYAKMAWNVVSAAYKAHFCLPFVVQTVSDASK